MFVSLILIFGVKRNWQIWNGFSLVKQKFEKPNNFFLFNFTGKRPRCLTFTPDTQHCNTTQNITQEIRKTIPYRSISHYPMHSCNTLIGKNYDWSLNQTTQPILPDIMFYLWGSWCGGGSSTWHDLLCDITPTLVWVSYSYLSDKENISNSHKICIQQQYLKSIQLRCIDWLTTATLYDKCYFYLQVKEKLLHWTDNTLSLYSFFLSNIKQEVRCPFVGTHYRFAFPFCRALWLCWWLLRRWGLLLLLGWADHDRCRLHWWRVLWLSWIVSSCCKK